MKRRDFLKMAGAAGAAMAGGSVMAAKGGSSAESEAPQKYKEFAVPAMDKVRVGFIGVGARGSGHVGHMIAIEGVEVKAICDRYQDWAERAAKRVVDAGQPAPDLYVGGEHEYRKMLDRGDLDIVIISTPWEWHVPMCVDAMNRGVHAFTEVPAAYTLEDCWKLVETAEKTERHCMMMENVNYGRDELMVLNMCRLGVLGDLLHGEAAYIHELRGQMNQVERGTGSWRTPHYMTRNGNLYPTHGLGPVSHYMNINRGDRYDYMSSISSKSKSRALYAKLNYPEDHKWNQGRFTCGDMNTSIIKTAMGRSIMVQWDENTPRPYDRLNLIQGTRGTWAGFPNRLIIEGETPSTHSWVQGGDLDEYRKKYEHPLFIKQGEIAQKMGGHGGMDFLMLWRIIYCLRNGEPIDQDVYDAAAWSAVGAISEMSVNNRGRCYDVPDFTRGKWKVREPLPVVS
jgi:hypothetical protein